MKNIEMFWNAILVGNFSLLQEIWRHTLINMKDRITNVILVKNGLQHLDIWRLTSRLSMRNKKISIVILAENHLIYLIIWRITLRKFIKDKSGHLKRHIKTYNVEEHITKFCKLYIAEQAVKHFQLKTMKHFFSFACRDIGSRNVNL